MKKLEKTHKTSKLQDTFNALPKEYFLLVSY